MNQTFQNSAQVLSIGIFFTLMIVGLAATLPHTMASGLKAHGVSPAAPSTSPRCRRCRSCSPRSSATTRSRAWSGTHALSALPAHDHAALTGRAFFPQLISGPFRERPARRVRVRDHRLPGRRGRVAAARRPLPARRGRAARRPTTRGAACTLSGTASRPSGCRPATTRPSPSTRSATCRASRRAGCTWDYPAIDGVDADLLLVTHEHLDHNGVERDRRRPADPALDGGHA